MSIFDGHRVYNGCPDGTLQAKIDAEQKAKRAIEAAGFVLVYFPAEERWMLFKTNPMQRIGHEFYSAQQAQQWLDREQEQAQ